MKKHIILFETISPEGKVCYFNPFYLICIEEATKDFKPIGSMIRVQAGSSSNVYYDKRNPLTVKQLIEERVTEEAL